MGGRSEEWQGERQETLDALELHAADSAQGSSKVTSAGQLACHWDPQVWGIHLSLQNRAESAAQTLLRDVEKALKNRQRNTAEGLTEVPKSKQRGIRLKELNH